MSNALRSEGLAVRALACIWILILAVGLAGCNTFGKKAQNKQAPPPQPQGNGNWGNPPAPGQDPLATGPRTPPGVSGILAGRVLDSYDRAPNGAFIQVVSVQQGDKKVAPIEVAADAQGYFTVLGLQPGQHYQLIARTRDGEPKLVGSSWGIPPNPRILIHLNEEFASPNTPPAPAFPGQKKAGSEASDSGSPAKPNSIRGPGRGAELGAPVRIEDGSSQAPRSGVHPERTSAGEVQIGQAVPLNIPVQVAGPARTRDPSPPPASTQASIPMARTRVPSCVLTGKQLDNFALYDIYGKPWEYRVNHRGKLVLLDFWGTWCVPCRYALPHMKVLQERYGPAGLEVIGIAYEHDAPFQDQVRKVQGLRDRLGLNYTLLMGSDMTTCPVKTQFQVSSFPTLVLIDENNRIIWRQEGLDNNRLNELETVIRQRLQIR